jgi:UDP-glucose 4-epimerase
LAWQHELYAHKGDLLNPIDLEKMKIEGYNLIFHIAANPEVKIGSTEPNIHFQQNIVATHNLLELVRKTGTQLTIVFASMKCSNLSNIA